MTLALDIRIGARHLMARRRQTLVSLSGIVLGVAFFLAISAMMKGSETDFIQRLVDSAPHITVSDDYRAPRLQPLQRLYPGAAVNIRRVKPLTETRGIRSYAQLLAGLRQDESLKATPVLAGQVLISSAGRDRAVTLSGVVPGDVAGVMSVQGHMILGSFDDLASNPEGIIVGDKLLERLSLSPGENMTVVTPTGEAHTFKIVGLFHTGRANYDEGQAFAELRRVQALLARPNRVNSIIVRLSDPYRAREVAEGVERQSGYKSVSWQEASEDLMASLNLRNIIMYAVVSAVLVVAAFGIYNVISTVVAEKRGDIAILKAMGFRSGDISRIFLVQGVILGAAGNILGLPLGAGFMLALGRVIVRYPGASEPLHLPIDWTWPQFALAGAFAFSAALLAAFLPARKAAGVQPVDILRGAQ